MTFILSLELSVSLAWVGLPFKSRGVVYRLACTSAFAVFSPSAFSLASSASTIRVLNCIYVVSLECVSPISRDLATYLPRTIASKEEARLMAHGVSQVSRFP